MTRNGEPVSRFFCLTGLSSFYKQAPYGRPGTGRLSVLEHVGRLAVERAARKLDEQAKKAPYIDFESLTSQVVR